MASHDVGGASENPLGVGEETTCPVGGAEDDHGCGPGRTSPQRRSGSREVAGTEPGHEEVDRMGKMAAACVEGKDGGGVLCR